MTALTTASLPIISRPAGTTLADAWQQAIQHVAGLPFVAREPGEAAVELVAAATRPGRIVGEHVHLANAYSIAVADEHRTIADVFTDEHGWLLPDGRPLVWLSALRGDALRLHQVRGPQFMLDVADLGRTAGLRHYLLGGSPEVLRDLEASLVERFPGIEIVGTCSPPFRPATSAELRERDDAIHDSGAQVVWVGLGTPKQDLEAARLAASLPVLAVAVGAAFDYAAGRMRPAPHWLSIVGLEWLWRFAAEPRRLWQRYTVGNARFLLAAFRSGLRSTQERDRSDRPAPTRNSSSRTTVVGQLPPPLHGSAVMTERLIEALEANGETVTVVDRRFSRSVAEVGRMSPRKLLAIPSLVGRFVSGMRGADRLVLLITCTPGSFLVDQLLLALTRKPTVLYVHTVGFRQLAARGRVWRHLVRRSFRRASRVVVLGPTLVDDIAPFTRRDRIAVIPNTTPGSPVGRHEPGKRVLFLSNLLPGKGADVFVRVARSLVTAQPTAAWSFDLAGAGDATQLGQLPGQLTVHGPVTGAAKAALLAEADVLVVPSTYAMEAQPLVIVEALSYGLPVVAFDTGGIRDLVDDSVGALVPAGDETALIEALAELLESPDHQRRVRSRARARYNRRHSTRAYTRAWHDVLLGRAVLSGAESSDR